MTSAACARSLSCANGRRPPTSSDRKSTRLNSSHTVISYAVFCLILRLPRSTLFPYTTLFRSVSADGEGIKRGVNLGLVPGVKCTCERCSDIAADERFAEHLDDVGGLRPFAQLRERAQAADVIRSEEHTSELQSHSDLVCRLLLDTPTTEIYTLSLHDALPICIC